MSMGMGVGLARKMSSVSVTSDNGSRRTMGKSASELGGGLRSADISEWINARKAVSLLDALQKHLQDRDQPVRLFGVEVSSTMILQLLGFLAVCTLGGIIEVLSGSVIFGSGGGSR